MPSFYANLRSALSAPIGNRQTSTPDDLVRTRRNFSRLGRYDGDTELSVLDRGLDNTIRAYQREKGLKQDGIMNPGGETERALNRDLGKVLRPVEQRQPLSTSPVRLSGAVGNNRENQNADVKQVQRSLGGLGLASESKLYEPSGILDRETLDTLQLFQKASDLRVDGYMNPGGETEAAMNAALQRLSAPSPADDDNDESEDDGDEDKDEPDCNDQEQALEDAKEELRMAQEELGKAIEHLEELRRELEALGKNNTCADTIANINALEKELVVLKDVHTESRKRISELEVKFAEAQKELQIITDRKFASRGVGMALSMSNSDSTGLGNYMRIIQNRLEAADEPDVIEAQEKVTSLQAELEAMQKRQASLEGSIQSKEAELLTLELRYSKNCS